MYKCPMFTAWRCWTKSSFMSWMRQSRIREISSHYSEHVQFKQSFFSGVSHLIFSDHLTADNRNHGKATPLIKEDYNITESRLESKKVYTNRN